MNASRVEVLETDLSSSEIQERQIASSSSQFELAFELAMRAQMRARELVPRLNELSASLVLDPKS